jgi:phage shock protein C
MYCSHCGRPRERDARFCSTCGTAFTQGYSPRRPLTRPRDRRVIAGVCAGFALEYGWDLALVRVLFAVVTVFTGLWIGIVAYAAGWIVIPEAPYALPEPGAGVSA